MLESRSSRQETSGIDPKAFLGSRRHVILAVVGEDGKPWAVPVAVQRYRRRAIEWISSVDALHSRAIERTADIALTAFVPKSNEGDEYGIYLRAHASKVIGMPGGLALYRAKIYEAWYNDHKHVKTHINLEDL